MQILQWVFGVLGDFQQLVHRTPGAGLLLVDGGLQLGFNKIARHLGVVSSLHEPVTAKEEAPLSDSQRLYLNDLEAWYARYRELHGELSLPVRVSLWLGFIPEI